MSCRHYTEPEANALYGCDGTCLVEQELEDRDDLTVCCCGNQKHPDWQACEECLMMVAEWAGAN